MERNRYSLQHILLAVLKAPAKSLTFSGFVEKLAQEMDSKKQRPGNGWLWEPPNSGCPLKTDPLLGPPDLRGANNLVPDVFFL